FVASPFVNLFLATPLGKELLAAPELAKLRGVDAEFQKKFQLSLGQLRDDILGDAIVLAYSPGPVDNPERERGLLLLEARNPEQLARLLGQVFAQQKESGEIKELQERQRGPHKYWAAAGPKSTNFFLRAGGILAVTSEEPLLFE